MAGELRYGRASSGMLLHSLHHLWCRSAEPDAVQVLLARRTPTYDERGLPE